MRPENIFIILHILNKGGKPRALIEALVEIIWQDLSEDFYLSPGSRDYIQREVEYLLDYLAHKTKVKGRFILNRIQALRLDLIKLKLVCPKKETSFSSLLNEDEDYDAIENEIYQLFAPSSFAIENELREKAEAREKTRERNFRLMRLENWKISCFFNDNSPKFQKFEQKSLFSL